MKKIPVLILIMVTMGSLAFSQATVAEMTGALDTFLGEINSSLPDNAVIGGVWSDAYIGQIIAVPPNFGVGISAGATKFVSEGLKQTAAYTGSDFDVDSLVLPSFAIEGRLGGIVLPFDVGVRVGILPEMTLQGVTMNYLHYGFDVRYAIVKGGLLMPKISLGVGYYHTAGDLSYTYETLVGIGTWTNTVGTTLDVAFKTDVIEAKAQISKKLVILTPYAGIGLYRAASVSSWSVYNVSNEVSETVTGYRFFGGTSLNLLILKVDLTGSWNPKSGNWGANLGGRIQF